MSTPATTNERTRADLRELAERIGRTNQRDGSLEVQPGLFFNRASRAPGDAVHGVIEPCLCVIAQGSKEVLLGEERFHYDPAHYLIATIEAPLVGQVVEASPEEPYLGIKLVLDPSLVTSVMVESGLVQTSDSGVKGVDVSPLGPELLDAVLRLVRLTDKPGEYHVLAPLVVREIVYRLLTGEQGARLRHVAKLGGQAHRMTRAVELIREQFDQPLRVEDIAKLLHMSVSGFHAHFKTVTAMSPLQFQKQLRLQEARRLMLSEDFDAAQAGFRVGYDDASHFSREYKRHFGEPPKRDIERLREAAGAGAIAS